MNDVVVVLVGALLGLLHAVALFLLARIFTMIGDLDKEIKGVYREIAGVTKDLADFKFHVATNYQTKDQREGRHGVQHG